ncbi:MAG TPA: type II toxin-antitoxin system prevent-host-death family antitoxin [Acidisarcina sp.]
MTVTHVSEADAARDFAAVMTRIRAGEEVVVEVESTPIAVLRPVRELRMLSESLRILKARGSTVTLDGDFAHDLESIVPVMINL